MRGIGTLHPTESPEIPADTISVLLIAGSSGQALDFTTGCQIARFTGVSTAGAQLNFGVALQSTAAAAPSSGTSGGTTGAFCSMVMGTRSFQIPGGSTGYSVAALSSGYVICEQWKKGG